MAGAALVIVAKASIDVLAPLGLAFAVGALLCLTGGTLYEKRFGAQIHPVASNFVQYGVGLAVSAPLAFWLEPMRIEWTGPLLAALAYLVVGNSLVAISLLLAMLPLLGMDAYLHLRTTASSAGLASRLASFIASACLTDGCLAGFTAMMP